MKRKTRIKFGFDSLPKEVSDVYINGVRNFSKEDYTVKGSVITFVKPITKGDYITVKLAKTIKI